MPEDYRTRVSNREGLKSTGKVFVMQWSLITVRFLMHVHAIVTSTKLQPPFTKPVNKLGYIYRK